MSVFPDCHSVNQATDQHGTKQMMEFIISELISVKIFHSGYIYHPYGTDISEYSTRSMMYTLSSIKCAKIWNMVSCSTP